MTEEQIKARIKDRFPLYSDYINSGKGSSESKQLMKKVARAEEQGKSVDDIIGKVADRYERTQRKRITDKGGRIVEFNDLGLQNKVNSGLMDKKTYEDIKNHWNAINNEAIAKGENPEGQYNEMYKLYGLDKPTTKTVQDKDGSFFEVQTTSDASKPWLAPQTSMNKGASNVEGRTTLGNYMEQNPESEASKAQAQGMGIVKDSIEEKKAKEQKAEDVKAPQNNTKAPETPETPDNDKKKEDPYKVSLVDAISAKLKGISNAMSILGHYSPIFSAEETADPYARMREIKRQAAEEAERRKGAIKADVAEGEARAENQEALEQLAGLKADADLIGYVKQKTIDSNVAVDLQKRINKLDTDKQKDIAKFMALLETDKQKELIKAANEGEQAMSKWRAANSDIVERAALAMSGSNKTIRNTKIATDIASDILGSITNVKSDRKLKYAIRMK